MKIPFSPPDIGDLEVAEVVDTLRSGWITTGPKTKRFEAEVAQWCHTSRAVCLNSATAAAECTLRVLGIGPGDEVITTWSAGLKDGAPIRLAGQEEAGEAADASGSTAGGTEAP